jgi:hypothetical protein
MPLAMRIIHSKQNFYKCDVILMYRDEVRAAADQGRPCVALVQLQFPSVQEDIGAFATRYEKHHHFSCWWRVAQDYKTGLK